MKTSVKRKIIAGGKFFGAIATPILATNIAYDQYKNSGGIPEWLGYILLGTAVLLWSVTVPEFIKEYSDINFSKKVRKARGIHKKRK